MSLLLNRVFANSKSVPQLDGAVARPGNDLPVVGRECDAEDVFGVSDKSSRRRPHRQIPQTKSGIPGAGQSKLSVRRQNDVRHEVTVALKSLVRETVVGVVFR